ncbi:flagellar hook-associated protein FlgL [Thermocrinis sp.]|jgi:flagellar hook-associated protein 3 FlgL|uniref:flagellar hook-associated protein FlgL n=1 Tax=Thermocrinis sp. TaxID=2024383 RepID=UPI002605B324|nr:flagellar hook-associated protein FlgL [Thermocrinis sp.]
MKVPDNLLFSLFIEQDARIKKGLSEKTLDVSTGRRVRALSDEPTATYNVIELKKEIAQLSQHSQNRLFADTNLTYVDFTLGKVWDTLKGLYATTIRAKNSATLTPDQLSALAEQFDKGLGHLLDMANDKLGQNYLFGGSSLTVKPFDPNTLNYTASSQDFEVWVSENSKVSVFLRGDKVFGSNLYISKVSFASPTTSFTTPGAITLQVGSNAYTISYGGAGEPQNIQELAQYINNNFGDKLHAFVSQNPDGSYSIALAPVELSASVQFIGVTGELSAGFENPNILQAVKRVKEKLQGGFYPDEFDLFSLNRAGELISLRRSEVGSVLSTVKNLQPTQEKLDVVLKKQKSDIEDANISESLMEYTRYRIAYEALMRMVADQKDLTILKYI